MKIPTKKLKNGFEIPVFGLGTWLMGGRKTYDPQNNDSRDIVAIQKAIELGVTHIDTAESYAAGHAETLVGIATRELDRSKLFIVSKVSSNHLRYDDVLKSCEASLKRIKTNYVDLYLIHSSNPILPIRDTIRALDRLVREKLVRNIGVSNFKKERFEEAQKYTKNKLVVNQVYYNLFRKEPEIEGLLKFCQKKDILLEAYRPLEKEMLFITSIPILDILTKKYRKTRAQIAINWLISQKNVITISKTSTIEHLRENLGAIGWKMENKDIEELRKAIEI